MYIQDDSIYRGCKVLHSVCLDYVCIRACASAITSAGFPTHRANSSLLLVWRTTNCDV